MILGTFLKQPAEIRRVTLDYGKEFLTRGDKINLATIQTTGTVTVLLTSTFPDTLVTMLISGGLDGTENLVTVTADTDAGECIESEILVTVEEISL